MKTLIKPKEFFDSEIFLKGSKSITNRAIIIASQCRKKCREESILFNASNSDDTNLLIKGLSKFGIEFNWKGEDLEIKPPENFIPYQGEIDIGPAGTTIRFLTSFIAGVEGAKVILKGTERMHQRPISDLVTALRDVGVEIEYLKKQGCPPIEIKGKVKQTSYSFIIKGDVSSQYITSLLISAYVLSFIC